MKKTLVSMYGIIWIFFLIFIGRNADEFLSWLIERLGLKDAPHVDGYVLAAAIFMIIVSTYLIWNARRQSVSRHLALRILIASLLGGTGSVWLSILILRYWFGL